MTFNGRAAVCAARAAAEGQRRGHVMDFHGFALSHRAAQNLPLTWNEKIGPMTRSRFSRKAIGPVRRPT